MPAKPPPLDPHGKFVPTDGQRSTFVSEQLQPDGKDFALPPAIGEPALPLRFVWRKERHKVKHVRRYWKEHQPEGHRAGAELYLRRHWFELEMDDGALWTVYFQRQPSSRRSTKARWWVYMVSPTPANDPTGHHDSLTPSG